MKHNVFLGVFSLKSFKDPSNISLSMFFLPEYWYQKCCAI